MFLSIYLSFFFNIRIIINIIIIIIYLFAAFFYIKIPKNAPASITIQPGADEMSSPCGVQYYLKIFVGDTAEEKPHKR